MAHRPGPRVGVLALQGGFAVHADALRDCGADVVEVRTPAQLEGCRALVMPGGESSTLLKLLRSTGLDRTIPRFHGGGGAILGTCAGAILLAKRVTDPQQRSLRLLDVDVQRNAYGRQIDSFETTAPLRGARRRLPLVFIRAPRFTRLGPDVETLVEHDGDAVLVREGRVLAATFHPELTRDRRVHRLLLELAGA